MIYGVLIKTKGESDQIYTYLNSVPTIREVVRLDSSNEFDILVKIEADTFGGLAQLITKNIRSISGVTGTRIRTR